MDIKPAYYALFEFGFLVSSDECQGTEGGWFRCFHCNTTMKLVLGLRGERNYFMHDAEALSGCKALPCPYLKYPPGTSYC